eukprot:g825.t1
MATKDTDATAKDTSGTRGTTSDEKSIDHEIVLQIFRILDVNKSGTIDVDEVSSLLQKMGVKRDTVKETLICADTNFDGQITLKEFDMLLAKAFAMDILPPLGAILSQLKTVAANASGGRASPPKIPTATRRRKMETINHDLVRKIFEILDDDNSGEIDMKELNQKMIEMNVEPDAIKEGMIAADVDMNGKISIQEFDLVLAKAHLLGKLPPLEAVLAQLEVIKKVHLQYVDRIFKLLDLDHSGSIDVVEAEAIMMRAGVRDIDIVVAMKGADRNFDGKVTRDELASFLKLASQSGMLPPLTAILSQLETIRGKKRVAVLGGMFAPPTDRHLLIAANVIHLDLADEVWLVPCGEKRPTVLKKNISGDGHTREAVIKLDFRDRLTMCHLAVDTTFSHSFPVHVCDEEKGETRALTTPELMARLRRKRPDCEFYFLAGSNLCNEIPSWPTGGVTDKNWYRREHFIIIERKNHPVPAEWMKMRNVIVAGSGQSIVDNRRRNEGKMDFPEPPRLENMVSGVMQKRFQHTLSAGLLPFAVENFLYKKTLIEKRLDESKSGDKRKRRVAIFGGSFNPITDGHLKMACEVMHSKTVDEVWLVPCGARPDKPSLKTPAIHRYIMCQLAVNSKLPMMTGSGDPFAVWVHDIELDAPKAYITPVLLRKLDKMYPHITFCFVAGADLLSGMHTWGGNDKSLDGWEKSREMIVLPRDGYKIPDEWHARRKDPSKPVWEIQPGKNVKLVSVPVGQIVTSNHSSSTLRKLIGTSEEVETRFRKSGLHCIEGLTALPVISHICRNGLFK